MPLSKTSEFTTPPDCANVAKVKLFFLFHCSEQLFSKNAFPSVCWMWYDKITKQRTVAITISQFCRCILLTKCHWKKISKYSIMVLILIKVQDCVYCKLTFLAFKLPPVLTICMLCLVIVESLNNLLWKFHSSVRSRLSLLSIFISKNIPPFWVPQFKKGRDHLEGIQQRAKKMIKNYERLSNLGLMEKKTEMESD